MEDMRTQRHNLSYFTTWSYCLNCLLLISNPSLFSSEFSSRLIHTLIYHKVLSLYLTSILWLWLLFVDSKCSDQVIWVISVLLTLLTPTCTWRAFVLVSFLFFHRILNLSIQKLFHKIIIILGSVFTNIREKIWF